MAAGVLPRFDLPGWLMLFSGAFLVLAAFFVWWTGPTVVEFDSEGYRKGLRSGSLEDLERVAVRDESVELQVADGRVLVADGLSSRDAELLGRDVRRAIEAFRGR